VNFKVHFSLTSAYSTIIFVALLHAVLANHGLSITCNRKTYPSEAVMLARGVRLYLPRVGS